MIVTRNKQLEEILSFLDDAENLVLAGCSECATFCGTGGEDQLCEWAERLEKSGKKVCAKIVLHGACNSQQDSIDLRSISESLECADAVVSFSCGSGTQAVMLSLRDDLPVYPGNDSVFVGEVHEHGFHEGCRTCGHCELGWTGGICPVTKCAKGLLNGPCGGSKKRKCEVNDWMECAWISIYERLEKLEQLDNLLPYRPPKDFSQDSHPRRVV